MIVGTLAAFHLLALGLAGSSAGDRSFENASEVHRFSFEPKEEDPNNYLQPANWSRRRGPGFPPYVRANIDRKTAFHGRQSLLVELNGAQFAYYSPLQSVDSEHSYVFRGRIRSKGLNNDAALLSVSLLDTTRKRVQRFVSQPVTGEHESWVAVEIGPFRPGPDVRFLVVGCHIAQGEKTDVRGQVWFDDLWLGSMPLLELSQGSGLHFLQPNEKISIHAHARGLTVGEPHRLHLRLENSTGDVLKKDDFDLNIDPQADSKTDLHRPIPWELPPIRNGFYRVHATLDRGGTTVLAKETSFVVMDPAPGISAGEFGWSVGLGPGELQLSELAEIASRSGVNWLKLPLWSAGQSEQKSDLARSKMSLFLDQLDSHKITLVGMLSDPPPQLTDEYAHQWVGTSKIFTKRRDFWYPSLEPIIARHSFRIHHWQLGGETDDSFVGLTALPQTLSAVKNEFDHIGHDARIGFHWRWNHPFPNVASSEQCFLSLGALPWLEGEELRANLEKSRASNLARWVLVAPPARSEQPAPVRAAELARQMLEAKLGGAEAIFAANPFDPERGLLNDDGSPTEMYLPWRTMALALKGATYRGQFDMVQGSPNAVFERGNEIVLVIWNSEPTTEEYYLGEQAEAVDLWGQRKKLVTDPATQAQVLEVGTTPLIVRGCSVPVAQWRLAVKYAKGRISSEYGQHADEIIGVNTFPQGLTGNVTVHFPPGWQIDPVLWPLHAASGEDYRLPMLLTFPRNTSLGEFRTWIDFEVSADRPYRFRVNLPYCVGLGDVDLKVTSRRTADGRLEVEQRIINNTEPLEILEFNCSLFIPGEVRLRHFVTRLGKGEDQRFYFVPNAKRGQELLLRAEQVDGLRVLNYRWTVEE
jgi:hypothetical protein